MTIAPNQEGPSRAHMIYVPIVVFSIICPLLIGLRIWSRLRKGGKLGSDDYSIIASLGFTLASSGLMIASCQYGFGQHAANLTPENKIGALKYFYLTQITYKTSINLTKCSILLLYCRIFGSVQWFKRACWILTACVAMYAIASVVATIFQCNPISRAFNKLIPGTCINIAHFWYANAGFSVATDLLILLMPMPLVYQLQIPRIQKIALVLVFALGGFVVITSCLRMTTIDIAAKSPDTTFDIGSTMWTMIEMNVAIVCACLPMVRPLIVRVFPKLMPKSSSRNKYGYGYDPHSGPASGYAAKGYFSSHSQDRGEPSEWARIDGKEGINLTTIRKGDQSSEEYILHEDKSQQQQHQQQHQHQRQQEQHASAIEQDIEGPSNPVKNGTGIQKTVQYSIEYSKANQRGDWARSGDQHQQHGQRLSTP